MRVTFVTAGLEHLGVEALAAYVRHHGHTPAVVYEPLPFSSGSGTDSRVLAALLDPTPEQTAARVLATDPDVVAFTSYSITHRWGVEVARAVKRRRALPVVFGGPHVSATPERSILEPAIDAVVEGEGEGALLDLLACAADGGFSRDDVPNCTFLTGAGVRRNPVRPLIHDLDSLPYADKSGFYAAAPELERELYIISRRGCPFRCSFCEYSTFPARYGNAKPVRRRSIDHLLGELRFWKERGRVRKVFFWDAIFTLDARWMEAFAKRYRAEIGIPFECYTHPHTMTDAMARWLAHAGCHMVRVGVQTVNGDTLSQMDRRGNRERVAQTLADMERHGLPYSVDHMIGLPGEGAEDQREALRFYNARRPERIVAHWMTYFPGTPAFAEARRDGRLSEAEVTRILDGAVGPGYMFAGDGHPLEEAEDLMELSNLFDLLPLLPQRTIAWLIEDRRYRLLRHARWLRQAGALALAVRGEPATREHVRHIFSTMMVGLRDGLRRKLTGRPPALGSTEGLVPPRPAAAAAAPGDKRFAIVGA